MPRPPSIVTFERCYLGAWLVGLVNLAVSWNARMEMAAIASGGAMNSGMVATTALIGAVIGAAISLTLWWFTARRASNVARWIVVAFYAFGLLGLLAGIARGTILPGVSGALDVVGWVLQTIAVIMLFRPDAKAWFERRSSVETL